MSAPSLLDAALSDLAGLGSDAATNPDPPPQPVPADLIYALGLVVLAHCRQHVAKRSGRPPHPFERNLLLHAAYAAELTPSRSKTDARDAARRRLGPSVTIAKIEKATTATDAELARRFGSVDAPSAKALIARAQEHLDRVDRDMRARQQAAAQLRSSDRHVRIARA